MRYILLIIPFFASLAFASPATGPTSNQKVYEKPEQVLEDLKRGFSAADLDFLEEVFGSRGRELIKTGDEVGDQVMMKRLGRRFNERAELVRLIPDDSFPHEKWYGVRYAKEGWILHIPLINRGEGWFFAVEYANKTEKRFRRALNEYLAVGTLFSLIKAQKTYRSMNPSGEYARKFISTPGKRDGLYWPAKVGEPLSPLNEIVAQAISDGYTSDDNEPVYHGYVYKILTKRGPNAKAGEKDFEVNGKLTAGVAFLAYPLKYGVSGDYSYVTSLDGQIYSKDFGPGSDRRVRKIETMENDRTWYILDRSSLGVKELLVD